MNDIITGLFSGGGVASIITYLFTRRRENTDHAVKIWKELVQELRGEIKELKLEVHELREELKNKQ